MLSTPYAVRDVCTKLIPFFETVAIYFILPAPLNPSILGLILKCLPIVTLMIFIISHGSSSNEKINYSRRILIGLLFSCFGDAFLVWPEYLELGMISFALGHLNYILAFGFDPLNLKCALVPVGIAVAAMANIFPGVSGTVLTIGVPVYTAIIGTMLWRALAQLNSIKDLKNWIKISSSVGGMLFVVSDLILGINMFKFRMNNGQVFVMTTYYAAQLGFALSVVDLNQSPNVKN